LPDCLIVAYKTLTIRQSQQAKNKIRSGQFIMVITIIGIGLIGGSISISLQENGFAQKVIGVDALREHEKKAVRRYLIDEALPLEAAVAQSDIIIVSTPVDIMLKVIPQVLDLISDQQVVVEVGSTKEQLLAHLKHHPKRSRLVASHPMAGTEYSGPEAAIPNLFDGKYTVLVDTDDSDKDAVLIVENMFKAMNMEIAYLDATDHDVHTAYVSHISHISSFALALTVLEKEKDEERIFELASSGFGSTVRLAKSSPDMWIPIFRQNRDNVMTILDEYIETLSKFRTMLIKKDFKQFYELIEEANSIKKIIK
jgi:prephenate dehydrogenase